MSDAEARYLESIVLFTGTFLNKARLAEAMCLFRVDPGPDLEDAVMGEIRADLMLLVEAAADFLGLRIEGRKS